VPLRSSGGQKERKLKKKKTHKVATSGLRLGPDQNLGGKTKEKDRKCPLFSLSLGNSNSAS
jgi:hypothetical protein